MTFFMCAYETYGPEQMLFGSDHPFKGWWENSVRWLKGLPISDEDKNKILYENPARLLNLSWQA